MSVIVVGAGWAGLAAAIELTRHKIPVTLLEAARHAGGRARGVDWGDLRVDNGQHLMIGAYRETLRLLHRVHAPHRPPLQRQALGLVLHTPQGRCAVRAPRLPAPLHLLTALATAHGLGWSERVAALRMSIALAASGFRVARDHSVGELLATHRQPARVVECLWEPLCLATLNTAPQRASAQVFCTVLRDAFAHRRADSDLLFSATDLGALFAAPAVHSIERHGGSVVFGERVTALRCSDRAVTGLETSRGARDAEHVILAVPAWTARTLLEANPALNKTATALAQLEYEPICTVYLRYPASVRLGATMIGMTGGYTQWLIDRASCGQPGVLAAVISARGAHMGLAGDQLAAHVRDEIARAFPALPAPLEHFTVREKRATFSCTVGINATRPTHVTALRGLWLAGDYTDTGYPATLEGAVRSGVTCAREIIRAYGRKL